MLKKIKKLSSFYFPRSSFIRGQSVVEILIALAIFAISISAVTIVFFGSQSVSVDAELNNQALYKAREQLESARMSAKNNFSSLVSASSTDGIFFKELFVQDSTPYKKTVTSRVSWQAGPLRNLKSELTTIISNWKAVIATGGDTGGFGISGDWRNPRTLGSVDLGPGNSATDLDVVNKIVYIASIASDSKKPDFYVINAVDGQNPVIVSSLNTGSGLNAIDVAGGYAYAANDDKDNQLQIINVNNFNNPVLTSSFQLPGVSGADAVGNSIAYHNSKVYIGTKKAAGPEFFIIDVSNPISPFYLGSININASVNAIKISGLLAYIAVSDAEESMKILDIGDPLNIIQIGGFISPNGENGNSIYIAGNKIYLGPMGSGYNLYVLDAADPANIANLGLKQIGYDVNNLIIKENLAFLGTSDSNKEFQVWDISNPSNIDFWSLYNFSQVATGIDYEDNIIYVSVRSNDGLRIITSSP